MIRKTEMLADDNGFEVVVEYDYEETKDADNGKLVYTELRSVELVTGGKGTSVLALLHPDQKETIISKLQYS